MKQVNIALDDIIYFHESSNRGKNDISNKKRALIIVNIINDNIPLEYYNNDYRWFNIADNIWKFQKKINHLITRI